MKKLLFPLVFMLIINVNAQHTYKPIFGDSVTSWYFYENFIFTAKEDTIIDSLHYKKLYYDNSAGFFELRRYAFIRTDSVNSKVYFKKDTSQFFKKDTNEYLLFDFTLEEGDTFRVFSDYGFTDYIIPKIDTIDSLKIIYLDTNFNQNV